MYACIRVGVFGRQDAFELGEREERERREVEASRLGWDRGGGRAGKAYDHFMTEESHKPRETLTPRRTRQELHIQTAVSSRQRYHEAQPGQTEARAFVVFVLESNLRFSIGGQASGMHQRHGGRGVLLARR